MFKMSVTICWEIRNRIQYKTQQPQKRCHQEGQYISIKSFGIKGHKFSLHGKFILIEQINQTHQDKLTHRKRLKIRGNFLILKLKKLYSKALNRELNKK